jgi:integrase
MARKKAESPSRSRRGDGSVYQRKDGRWVGEASVGLRADGGRQRRYVYADTREEAQAALRKLLHERDRGLLADPGKQTVGQFLTAWLEDVVKPSVRPNTYRSYADVVNRHISPALGRIRLTKLSPQHLQRFYREKQDEGLTRTVRLCHSVLHRSLGQATKWGLIPRNPASVVDPPRVSKKEFRPLSPEEAQRFLEAVEGDRFYALYVLAITCGLRQGELLGLTWENVDLDKGILQVRYQLQWVRKETAKSGQQEYGEKDGKRKRQERIWVLTEPKSAKSRRTVMLPQVAVQALKKHRRQQIAEKLKMGEVWQDLGFVFTTPIGTPQDASNVRRRSFEPLLERAGVPKIRFHDLRHTCATVLLAQGVHPKVVQEQLGHSQISLTLDTYSHILPTLQQEAANEMDKMFGKRKAGDKDAVSQDKTTG